MKSIRLCVMRFNVAFLLVLNGCGGGSNPVPPDPSPTSTATSASATVDSSGATIKTSNASAVVRIPPNALSTKSLLTIDQSGSALPPGQIGNTAWDFGPDGTVFTIPIELSLTYDPAEIPDGISEQNLSLAFNNQGNWQPLTTTVDAFNKKLTATTSHFSAYAVTTSASKKLPYGTIIGDVNAVTVYSNGCFEPTKCGGPNPDVVNSYSGYKTGFAWQCVEFVNRYYYQKYGLKIREPFRNANQYYLTAADRGLISFPNEGGEPPKVGDVLVSEGGKNGHVAIVTQVSDSLVTYAQQNWHEGPDDLSSTARVTKVGGTYHVGPFGGAKAWPIKGWLRAPGTPGSTPPTVTISANPTTITSGQSSILTWSSTNATSCTASGGWSGSKTTSGSTSVSPTATTTYTLSCNGSGGTASNNATVNVAALIAPTVSITASPTTITSGQSSTLTWSSTNAASCTASGGWNGSQPVSGSTTVTPGTTTTYTLTCAGAGGTGSNSTTVNVSAISAPTVLIAASPTSITAGQSATLTWSSTNATSCTASGGWTGSQPVSGSISVTPTSTTIYTLACSGPGGTDNKSTTVNVAGTTPSVTTGPLNDTGITPSQCYQAGSDVLVSCTSAEALALNDKQDGMVGRDVTANDTSDGALGFSFRLVAKAGGGNYDKTECVFDAVTGLTWEGKPASGLRGGGNTYTNWGDGRSGDASEYVGYVNSVSLCGHTDWRLPTVTELLGIVNYGIAFPGPMIDGAWFPNTVNFYWFSSAYAGRADDASGVDFGNGLVGIGDRSSSFHVRLVR